MPEAAVHEYDRIVPRQNDVRLTGKILAMEAEAVAQRVEEGSDANLRLGVLPSYRSHIAASLFRSVDVDHHASPAFSCLSRTRAMNPVKSRSHVLCGSLYVF